MPTKDGFDPAYPLPRFLAEPQFLADQAEQGTGNAPDRAVPASRAVKASMLIATLTAIGIAALAMGNPMALFAEEPASLAGNSSAQLTPTIQSAADAPASVSSAADTQALSQTTMDAPSRNEIATSEPAGKDQAENSEPASETLFTQFQAWAAQQEAQPHGEPVQPVQDAPARVVQNAPAPAAETARVPHRLAQKHRQVRAAGNARAEMRAQKLRKQVRRVQAAPAERRPPLQDARAQAQPAQNAQAPALLPTFGFGN